MCIRDSYWSMRGHLAEAVDWLDRALATTAPDAEPRASAYLARAHIRWLRGEYEAARGDAQTCADLCRELGPSQMLFAAITLLAILSSHMGDWNTAARLHEEAFQLAWQLKDPRWLASSLNNLGLIAMERGDIEVGRSRLEQALTAIGQAGDRFTAALILDSLARVNLKLGDDIAARRNFLEALSISAQFRDAVNAAPALEGLAELELGQGKPQRALQLASAASSLREDIGVEGVPDWKQQVDGTLSSARAKLSREAAETAWRQGATMSIEEVLRYARGAPAPTTDDGGSPLTARERQVALLIADGLTNAAIAAHLKMAERTADAHVEHIRNKLGLRSRSQIAVWAHQRLGKA